MASSTGRFPIYFLCRVYSVTVKRKNKTFAYYWQRIVVWGQVPRRGSPDFRWHGWSNGGKNQEKKNPLGFKQNSKKSLDQNLTPKKSHAEFPSHKNFQKALNDITRRIETLVFNTQKTPYFNQATQKILAKIFQPKKIQKSKISTPKKSFDHPCHLNSGVPPPPLGSG